MTVSAELLKRNQQLEYFLCIEGIGWPADWADLSDGFVGTVWSTGDLNANLAATLGCTVLQGLGLPRSIDMAVDPRTCAFTVSGMSIKIQDRSTWWAQNFTPRKTGISTTLYASIGNKETTIVLVDGTNFSTGQVVWLGGKECVKLGTKALVSGVRYQYTGSTRGYLGTRAGSTLRQPALYRMNIWPAGTTVCNVARFWINRRVALFGHVPGETDGDCYLMWSGLLKSIASPSVGVEWDLMCNSDFMATANKIRVAKDWTLKSDRVGLAPSPLETSGGSFQDMHPVTVADQARNKERTLEFDGPFVGPEDLCGSKNGEYELALAYNYRPTSGGVPGMVAAWDTGSIQTIDTSAKTVVGTFVKIGDQVLFMSTRGGVFSSYILPEFIKADIISSAGTTSLEEKAGRIDGSKDLTFKPGERVRFLLANWHDTPRYNRFQVNGVSAGAISRNPINILLFFLTSMDAEFDLFDLSGGGHTTTTVNMGALGVANDYYVGKTLFCVEGACQHESRLITANTNTSITVETAFSSTPNDGEEFQIRNSPYDVLPFGWGMGIDSALIDIDSFEDLRDKYYPNAVVDKFIIGTEQTLNIWELLQENICKPYGVMIYQDRSTRKIAAKYLSSAVNNDTIDAYVSITESDIIEGGSLDHNFVNPLGKLIVNVRPVEVAITGGVFADYGSIAPVKERVPMLFDSKQDSLVVVPSEVVNAFGDQETETLEINAMFDTRNTADPIVQRLAGVINLYNVPPPLWTCKLRVGLWPQLYPGMLVSITWASAPVNPYTGTNGWTSVVGRVLSMSLPLDGKSLAMSCQIEIFEGLTRGKVAPCATVTSKGNDGTYDYFVVSEYDFINDQQAGIKDYYGFAVGDLIDLQDITGTIKESETIHSFGTNHSSTPAGANSARINVVGSIGSTIATGDCVAFTPWGVNNTSNMETYVALANDTTEELTGGDTARVYI